MVDLLIDGPDGGIEAWVARPAAGAGDVPGVLLYMDAIGLRPQIRQMADRIAGWGYVVLAPNTFHHFGSAEETSPDAPLLTTEARAAFLEEAGPRLAALTSAMSRADTDRYLETLRGLDGVSPAPITVVGYCMGVRLAMRAAGDHPDVVGGVCGFHGGGLVTDDDDSPHKWLTTTRARVMLRHADNDRSMTPEHMDVISEAAAAAGVELDQTVYPDAVHGYTMADTVMYGEEAAERHYVDLRAFLEALHG